MKKLVCTRNLDKAEWLKYRKLGIGGSDAGAICGLNPYRTAMQVFQDKISDDIEELDNEAMRQGRELEDYVARRFMEATGKKVRKANYMFCSEEHPFMLADVDRMLCGGRIGLECKTASPYLADKWEDGKIPLSYQIQCFHYMAVCNADAWYIAVLIYGREFKYYRLERDEEMIADLIQIEKNFWENYVQKHIMPEPDGSKAADSVIAEYFKNSVEETVPLVGFDERLKRREELLGVIERMEAEKRQIEQEVKMFLGSSERAEGEGYRVSWKSICTNRIDAERLKTEKPEIYREYLKSTDSRRLIIKAA